ncbi:hypothetical protein Nepgr_002741 [Nepenthes gracilis]|uniref:Uncharacterized protein n=1 Tax=Nepenthes gracilis TaxID=150966 RepID=A0AAD3RX80_NEPGR|nr:hypothetical protein Nepgr_002741 [Nepenthes gracilis]
MQLGEAVEASRRQMPVNRVDWLNEGGPAFFKILTSQQFDQSRRHMGRLAHGRPGRAVMLVLGQQRRYRGKRYVNLPVGINGRRTQ